MELNVRDLIEQEIVNIVTTTISKIIDNHCVIYGCNEDTSATVCKDLCDKIKNFCFDLNKESEDEKHSVIENIELLLKECMKLARELNLDDRNDYPDSMTLNEVLNSLNEKHARFSSTKKQRLEAYKTLKEMEEELCCHLKERTMEKCQGVPTESYLNKLDDHVRELNEYKEQLTDNINSYRDKIKNLMHKIEVTPVTSVELFCFGESSVLPFSKETLEKLQNLVEKLESQQRRMVEEAENLRVSLSTLWSRIETPLSAREKILLECSGFTKGTIAKLKAELKRCEEVKQRNMMQYIIKIKDELQDYWSRCMFSEAEKNQCRPFFSTHYTEDVANVLEIELRNMREFYAKYEPVYQLYEKRQELWQRFQQLEASSKDVNRLFNNRGGALLKEENERKRIQKELPKIEAKLNGILEEFKRDEHRDFTINGDKLQDLIKNTWNKWYKKKDQEKTARKVANANTLAVESHLGTQVGMKRKVPGSATRSQNVSNKLYRGDGSSDLSTNTLYSTGSSTALGSLKKKASALKTVKQKTPISRGGRNMVTPSFSTTRHDVFNTPSNNSTSSSYSLFQENLEEKSDPQKTPCSNAVSTGNILKPRNTPVAAHSSPKTPRYTPYYKTRSNTKVTASHHKSPFKFGTATKIPTLTLPMKSPRNTPQLRTPRRKLPIII